MPQKIRLTVEQIDFINELFLQARTRNLNLHEIVPKFFYLRFQTKVAYATIQKLEKDNFMSIDENLAQSISDMSKLKI
jgi:hypothetical protein